MWFLCMGRLYVKLSPWYYVVPMYGTALREGVTLVLCGSYAWDGFT